MGRIRTVEVVDPKPPRRNVAGKGIATYLGCSDGYRENSGEIEDRFLYGATAMFMAVADGVGGYGGGDEAANFVVETVNDSLKKGIVQGRNMDSFLITEAIRDSHRAISKVGSLATKKAGTTLTLATFSSDGDLILANIGDSRATVVTPDGAIYATSDECLSLVSGKENVIISGLFAGMEFDRPTITVIPGEKVPENSLIVLTSDGIHGDRPEERIDIPKIIWENREGTPGKIADALTDAAIKNDDRTVMVGRTN